MVRCDRDGLTPLLAAAMGGHEAVAVEIMRHAVAKQQRIAELQARDEAIARSKRDVADIRAAKLEAKAVLKAKAMKAKQRS